MAAIENKRGNFEKSIDLYNYALSKDKIPVGNSKTRSPFVSVEVGIASDNTIKANMSGRREDLKTNLIPIRRALDKNSKKPLLNSHTSEISTNVATTLKEEKKREQRISHPKPENLQTPQKEIFPKNKLKNNTVENSPLVCQKNMRKAWRMGKNQKHMTNTELVSGKEYPVGFYSLGNSLNKAESASISSGNQFTSNLQSSQDTKSSITNQKSAKIKKKVKKINFSDRMLSSKLYSIKRQEIFLYDGRRKYKVNFT